jgi:hypothetical protein
MMGSNQLNGTTDSSATKNTKNIDKDTDNWYGLLHIPLSKYPKIAKKSVRLLLRVKHIVPTLTDEDKVTICVEKKTQVCFPREKKRVGEHPLIESRGAVFRRSEDGCALRV